MDNLTPYAKQKRDTALEIEKQLSELIFQALDDIRSLRTGISPLQEGEQANGKSQILYSPGNLKTFLDCYEKTDKITREEKKNPSYTAEEEGTTGLTISDIVEQDKKSIKETVKEMLSGLISS